MKKTASALEDLFPGNLKNKFLKIFPIEPLWHHRSLSSLPDLFKTGPLSSFEALAFKYKGEFQINGGKGKDADQFSVHGHKPRDFYKFGLTVYFQSIESQFPEVHQWVNRLETELAIPHGTAFVGAFASPESKGLEPHYDPYEVIMIQVQGRKKVLIAKNEIPNPIAEYNPRFTPHPNSYPYYTEGFPLERPKKVTTVDLTPGSVLFMPKGTWHQTEAIGKESLGVSIFLKLPTLSDLLVTALRWEFLKNPSLRKSLHGFWPNRMNHSSELSEMKSLFAEAGKVFLKTEPKDVLQYALSKAEDLENTSEDSYFQMNPSIQFTVKKGKEKEVNHVSIQAFWGTNIAQLQLPVQSQPLLDWISKKREAFQVRDVLTQFPTLIPKTVVDTLIALAKSTAIIKLRFKI